MLPGFKYTMQKQNIVAHLDTVFPSKTKPPVMKKKRENNIYFIPDCMHLNKLPITFLFWGVVKSESESVIVYQAVCSNLTS